MSRYYSRRYDDPEYVYDYRRNNDNYWTYQPVQRRAIAYAPSYVYGNYGSYGGYGSAGYGRGYQTTSDYTYRSPSDYTYRSPSDYTYRSPYTGYTYTDCPPNYKDNLFYSHGIPRYSRYNNRY